MTDLSAFGVTAEEPETTVEVEEDEPTPGRHESYRNGRCRAIKDGEARRCRSDATMSSDLCGIHDAHVTCATIDDGPRNLIAATTGEPWSEFGNWIVRGAIKDIEWELEHGEGST